MEAQNDLKKDYEMCFLAFFGAKMTKIDILNPKLIVPHDYQQF